MPVALFGLYLPLVGNIPMEENLLSNSAFKFTNDNTQVSGYNSIIHSFLLISCKFMKAYNGQESS